MKNIIDFNVCFFLYINLHSYDLLTKKTVTKIAFVGCITSLVVYAYQSLNHLTTAQLNLYNA